MGTLFEKQWKLVLSSSILNVLINFSSLKKGGGQNVAMNFLYEISNIKLSSLNIFYFVANNSEPHKFLNNISYEHLHVVPNNPIKRILFEIFFSKKILEINNIDIIYSYFGFGLFPKIIPQVSGSADSNLYFPEIDFWSHYSGIDRIKKKIIDSYRIYGLKRANAVVFENPIMEEKAKELFDLKNTIYIKPSIQLLSLDNDYEIPEIPETKIKKGLFLCGWQLNKNVMKIPQIAYQLKKLKFNFTFILTAPKDNSKEHKEFKKLVARYNVNRNIVLLGPISKQSLSSLYQKIDYVFLLSKLESFSNNIIESWYFKKPLIVSNEPWSKAICNNAASYVNRSSPIEIAKKIIFLENNPKIKKSIIQNGNSMMDNFPSINKRIKHEIDFLKDVYNKN